MGMNVPKTWAAGDPWTGTDANKQIRDNFAYLKGDPQWMFPTAQNSWQNYNATYNPMGYRRYGRLIQLRGTIANSIGATIGIQGPPGTTNVIFYLPVGWRPYDNKVFSAGANGMVGRVDIYTDGGVCAIAGDYHYLSLDTIVYPIA